MSNFITKLKQIDKKNYLICFLIVSITALSIVKLGIIKGTIFALFTDIMIIYYKNGGKIMARRKQKEKKKKTKKTLSKIITSILICLIGLILFFGAFLAYVVATAPEFNPNAFAYKESSLVFDKNGDEIATLAVEKREKITYEDLPQVLVDALIATEDSRFFQHNGFDLPRFVKASIYQLIGKSDAGGASTISMQVIKNNFTNATDVSGIKGIIRKFTDIYMAVFKLEKNYTKEEIIEFYVNDSLLGVNNYGVEQASQYYFGKSVTDLTLTEAAIIVGLYQSPNKYNPYKYPEAADKRRATVLNLMVRHGYITKEEAEIAKNIPIESLLAGVKDQGKYQGFIDTVIEEVIKNTGVSPYDVPMKIYTTMDKSIQDNISNIMMGDGFTWAHEKVQAGIAVVDVNTGGISAIGNGRNKTDARTYNLATRTKRQPGSTAKPLFDFGPGFEYNNYSTYTLFYDEEWSYTGSDKIVNNWDGEYNGLTTVRTALAWSRNIPSLKAFQEQSKKNIRDFVTSLGLEPELENGTIHEGHAIGAFNGTSPLQLATAYSSFANGGYHTDPYSVTKIVYRSNGEEKEFKTKKERVMSESTAYLMNNILKFAADYGFNGGAKVNGLSVAVKTGTTNFPDDVMESHNLPSDAAHDVWTIAYTPTHSIALWYGYETLDEGYLTGNYNGEKEQIMQQVMKSIPKTGEEFNIPSTVVTSEVEFGTNPAMLPSEYTPKELIQTEVFKKGTEPTEVSPRFAKLDDVKDLELTYKKNAGTIILTWDYELPEVLTTNYLTNFFNQPLFGKSSEKALAERVEYNNTTLGGYGFGIYLQNNDGSLERISFTTDSTYIYTISESISNTLTFVVKAEYGIFKDNASDGIIEEINISSSGTINPLPEGMSIALNGKSIINVKINSPYNEPDPPIKVTFNSKDITNNCNITVSVKHNTSTYNVTNTNPINKIIDTTDAGIYRITYQIKYKNNTYTKIRTVNIIT